MKFTIERSELLRLAASADLVSEKHNIIPILGCCLIQATEDGISVLATDMDRQVELRAECQVEDPGVAVVSTTRLKQFVASLPAGSQIACAAHGQTLSLRCGRSHAALPSLDEATFPKWSGISHGANGILAAAELLRILSRTAHAISNEGARYYLNGVLFRPERNGMLVACSTDGNQMSVVEVICPDGLSEMPEIILPSMTVKVLMRLLPDAGDVGIAVSDERIAFSIGGTVLSSKLINGTFPDFRRVVPATTKDPFVVNRRALASSIARASVTADRNGRTNIIRIGFADGTMRISTRSEWGDVVDEIEANGSTEPAETGVAGQQISAAIDRATGETVSIYLGDQMAPIRVQGSDDAATDFFITMPMRV